MKKPYFVIFGNEKGGTGKSTIAFHIIINFLKLGLKVGSIDVDARQGTLTKYIANRKLYCQQNNEQLLIPEHFAIHKSDNNNYQEACNEEKSRLSETLEKLNHCDVVVIDTPGNYTNLSSMSHALADTIITPINDSLIDLDVLVSIEQNMQGRARPSIYSEMVWEQKKKRIIHDKKEIDWIVIRNRLSNIISKNKLYMEKVLIELQKRIGFRQGAGFSERVVFRELFLKGKTLLDMKESELTLSHVAALQELRDLMNLLAIDRLEQKIS